jgi:hypothetical protein
MSKRIAMRLVIAAIAVAVTTYALTIVRSKGQQIAESKQEPITAVNRRPNKVRAGALWPQLRFYLKALGNRLEQPGNERLMLAGTLDRAGEAIAFTAVSEFPDRLSLTKSAAGQAQTITFDGQRAHVPENNPNAADRDLIDSLINDTAEHFFSVQSQGVPTRHLGNNFRADDGSTEYYTGPVHDVFSVVDTTTPDTPTKIYYFSSETHLLEKVTYQVSRNGQTVEVETRFSDWKRIDNQEVAHRVLRFENGQQVMSLTITGTAFGPRRNDGMFGF